MPVHWARLGRTSLSRMPRTRTPEDLVQANALVIPWIAAVVGQRLSNDGPSLRAVTEGAGWLGDARTKDVAPYSLFAGSKPDANWLPDEATARGWRTLAGVAK